MEDHSQVSKLLRLKRYEMPPPGYYDRVLNDFRRRQRADLMTRPAYVEMWEKFLGLWPNFRVPQFAYTAIIALALGASVVIFSPMATTSGPTLASNSAPSPTSNFTLTPQRPVTIPSATMPVSSGSDLSQHYVLQPRPVSNERPLSF